MPSPSLTVSPSTVTVGGSVTLDGSGWTPNDTIDITITYRTTALGAARVFAPVAYSVPLLRQPTVVADATGSFTAVETLTQVGTAVITATDPLTGQTATVTVTVLASGALPTTGGNTDYLTLGLIGSAIAAVGAVLFVVVRSRRRKQVTAE
jgi:LPXTG-motif cell wall-anchored protein